MDRAGHNGRPNPIVALVFALVLAVLPLPAPLAPFKPPWVALVLIYLALGWPHTAAFFAAFCAGLALDGLSGSLIGQHPLALLIVVYIVRKFHLRLRAFPVSQLALTVGLLLGLYQFVLFWIDGVAGRTVPAVQSWGPVLSGTLAWALMWSLFDRGRRRAPARL